MHIQLDVFTETSSLKCPPTFQEQGSGQNSLHYSNYSYQVKNFSRMCCAKDLEPSGTVKLLSVNYFSVRIFVLKLQGFCFLLKTETLRKPDWQSSVFIRTFTSNVLKFATNMNRLQCILNLLFHCHSEIVDLLPFILFTMLVNLIKTISQFKYIICIKNRMPLKL